MRRLFLMAILASMTMPLMAQHIHVSTVNTSLVLDARQGGSLRFVYYGQRLNDPEQVFSDGRHTLDAYPAYGMQTQHETALSVVHTDGNMTLDLVVEGSETRNESNATVKVVRMKDKFYPFYVNVCYRTYSDKDIIETWAEYSHKEKGTVRLTQFASAYLPIRYGQVWISHLYGTWANEGRLDAEPLKHGMFVIQNKDGVRNSHTSHSEVMFSLDGKPQENHGRVIGAALCYSGNYICSDIRRS